MYSLKTTGLKTSLYDAIPVLCFFWGLVLACHLAFSPQFYLDLSLTLAICVSLLVLIKRWLSREQGSICIIANQAYLETHKGRYHIQFESYNGWRLLARLIPESTMPAPDTLSGYFSVTYLVRWSKRFFFESRFLSLYHSMVKPEDYAYLRSFAAYQCHMRKSHSP